MQSESSVNESSNEKIRVLLVEGEESSGTWLQEQVKNQAGQLEIEWKKDYRSGLAACLSGQYHLGLIGAEVASSVKELQSGLGFIQEARKKACNMPLLFFTSTEQLQASDLSQLDVAQEVLTKDQVKNSGLKRCISRRLQEKQLENQYSKEKDKLKATLNCVESAVILVRASGAIDFMNVAAEFMLGMSVADVVGRSLKECLNLTDEVNEAPLLENFSEYVANDEVVHFGSDAILIAAGGEKFYVECSLTPVYLGADPQQGGVNQNWVFAMNDITDVRKSSEQLRHETTHDQLTGLPNRAEFEKAIQQSIEHAQEQGTQHCALYLDVDQFKIVNDTCGHLAGDELLIQLSSLLKGHLRRRDIVSRLNGDEFGIVLWRANLAESKIVIDAILATLSEYRFQWNDKSFAITLSIGVSQIDPTCTTWAEVLSRADSACSQAKEHGRNRIHVYDSTDPETLKRFGEMEWVAEIVKGLEEEGFEFYCQEIRPAGVVDGKPAGKSDHTAKSHYEVLLRYADDYGQVYLPEDFLPAAERYRIITMLDRWVISHVLDWLAENPNRLDSMDMLCINLSGVTIQDDSALELFQALLRETTVDLRKICFEITETVAVSFLQRASYFIKEIKKFGCSFSLDNFGSGMSSFAYLKHLPVDYIKIDGGFSSQLAEDNVDFSLVKAINDVAHIMNKKTIATCCENTETFKKYQEIGVDFVQGYFIGHPAPLDPKE